MARAHLCAQLETRCSPEYTKAVAAELGVPAVVPDVGPLWTSDASHLCSWSAKRFGRALLRELGTLDVVHRIAKAQPHDPRAR